MWNTDPLRPTASLYCSRCMQERAQTQLSTMMTDKSKEVSTFARLVYLGDFYFIGFVCWVSSLQAKMKTLQLTYKVWRKCRPAKEEKSVQQEYHLRQKVRCEPNALFSFSTGISSMSLTAETSSFHCSAQFMVRAFSPIQFYFPNLFYSLPVTDFLHGFLVWSLAQLLFESMSPWFQFFDLLLL